MDYEPKNDFERAVLDKLAELEHVARSAWNASVATHRELEGLRTETKVLADAADGARRAAEDAERRAVAVEERSAANGRAERHQRPTDPDLRRYESDAPPGDGNA